MTEPVYRLLWLAAALVGVANFVMFVVDLSGPCLLAGVVCTIACAITFESTWRK